MWLFLLPEFSFPVQQQRGEGVLTYKFHIFDKNDGKNGRGKKILGRGVGGMRKDLNGPSICINLRGTLGKIADKIVNISTEAGLLWWGRRGYEIWVLRELLSPLLAAEYRMRRKKVK